MTKDDNNRNHSAKYDHRNLMTEIRSIKTEPGRNPWDPGPIDVLYITIFKYDEAGNRIRKTVEKYEGGDPDPVYENTGDNPGWHTVSDEYYVRDVSGKEIAIYSGSSLVLWNIWGLDNVGKINADTTRNYYLKDHLGSIRVVLNSTNQVISAQDYDAWGYPLENRTYNATTMKYDFTGKERDDQTSYDYFGARYYDSRIGRWGQVEPKLEKFLGFSAYIYSMSNPLNYADYNGKEILFKDLGEHQSTLVKNLSEVTGLKLQVKEGELTYDKESFMKGNLEGSSLTRNLLISAMENSKTVTVELVEGVSEGTNSKIRLSPDQIKSFINGTVGLNENTMGWALVFLHELYHTDLGGNLGMDEEDLTYGTIGEIEEKINKIREELGLDYGKRFSYKAAELESGKKYVPFNQTTWERFFQGRDPIRSEHKWVEY